VTDSLHKHRGFVRLWAGQSISQLGSQITLLALPLVAIRSLDAGPLQLGILAACETLPFLIVGLPAGVWVDRRLRRPILVSSDIGRALVLATVPLAYAFGVLTVAQLFVVAIATGILTVFFDVAYQAYLPALVPTERLVEGNAKLEMSRSVAQVAGPGVGGLLVEVLRAPYAVAADSLSFVLSAAFLARIRERETPPVRHDDDPETMRKAIAEGLRYVIHHPLLARIAACTAVFNLFSAVGMAVFLLYAVEEIEIGPALIGLIFSLGSIGFAIGASLAERMGRAFGVGRSLVAAAAVQGAAFLLVPVAPREYAVAFFLVSMALETAAAAVYNITQVSLRQTVTPARMQGRMNATMRFVVWGALPLGSLLGGALGRVVGLRTTLWVSAVGGTFSVLPLLAASVLRMRWMPSPADEAA
jgi:MFS family permease